MAEAKGTDRLKAVQDKVADQVRYWEGIRQMSQQTLGLRLKELREQLGWTRYRLSKECDTIASHLKQLELGKHDPYMSTLQRIVLAMGISMEDFFSGRQLKVESRRKGQRHDI